MYKFGILKNIHILQSKKLLRGHFSDVARFPNSQSNCCVAFSSSCSTNRITEYAVQQLFSTTNDIAFCLRTFTNGYILAGKYLSNQHIISNCAPVTTLTLNRGLGFSMHLNPILYNQVAEEARKEMACKEMSSEYFTDMINSIPFKIPKRYKIEKRIGFGAQGQVVSAMDSDRNERVAIKKFLKGFSTDPNAKRTYREIYLMRNLSHPNIISMLNLFTPDPDVGNLEEIYIVMDLAKYNLSSLIRKMETPFDHRTLQGMVYQMLSAVQYMHLCGVAHRDMKPSNIVVKFDKEGQNVVCLKILDFGLARSMMQTENMESHLTPYVVTRFYRAPEIIVGLPYGCEVDVWSVGCIMAELILGHPAMKGQDYVDQWNKVCEVRGTPGEDYFAQLVPTVQEYCRRRPHHDKMPLEALFPDHRFYNHRKEDVDLNPLARSLIDGLLVIPVDARLSVEQALRHKYFVEWFSERDANPPHKKIVEDIMDIENYTKKEWKELVWKEVALFEQPCVELPGVTEPCVAEPMDTMGGATAGTQ